MQTSDTPVLPSPKPARLAFVASAVALTACAGGAVVFAMSSSDAMIKAGFERVFATIEPSAGMQPASPLRVAAKSEDEWLRVAGNPNVIRTAAVGEVIRLRGAGPDRTLRIVEVQDAGEASTHIDTSANRSRVLLVTCREGDEASGSEVHLRLEGGYLRDVAIAQAAHSL